ncbi:MAG: U32 family peptidase [Clostridia bacterium]|nr:U32 family peptidase [Clostridia bacterium]
MRKIELLSPAGGMEALHAAVQNGADAVYLGEKSFSARQGAENFGTSELRDAVKYAHERGALVYLAMNTLVGKNELSGFEKGINTAAECGVDALIVQDFGCAHMARSICPELPIHASTQMSAHNEKDVEYLLKRGFSRIVLARELELEEIEKIYKNTRASLEVFVHGALCVCVSGQCLMSSFIGGRSGNRGSCAQPCRQLYTAEGKKGYFLSPRDLCLIDSLADLKKAGVDSLKIEGRMKSPEYVATVTGMYRKYLDSAKKVSGEDVRELEKIFVRGDGFTKAYFAHVNTPEMMNYSMSNDGISYRSDKDVLKKAAATYRDGVENKKVPVTGYFRMKQNEETMLVLSDGINSATAYATVPEIAINRPIDSTAANERIGKMGQTPFVLDYLECDMDENLTLSAKDINALRRDCTDALLKMRGAVEKRSVGKFEYSYSKRKRDGYSIAVSVMNKEQLEGAKNADLIYMPLELFANSDKKDNYIVELPKVTYDVKAYIDRLKECGAKRVAASTYGVLKALSDEGFDCVGNYGLNVYNPLTACEYAKEGIGHLTLSPELGADGIRTVTDNTDAVCEALCYGRQMMMTTRACLIKGVRKRCNCEKPLRLSDKTGAEFLVYSDKYEHINTLYNSAVTFMADKKEVISSLGVDIIRLVFTDETKDTVERVIGMYKGTKEIEMPKKFTRGYFSNSGKNKQRGR